MRKSLREYSFPENYSVDSKKDVYDFLSNIYTDLSQQLFIERNFKYYFPVIYKDFLSYSFPEDFKFTQKLWHYFNEDYNCQLGYCHCEGCNKRCKFDGLRFGYRMFCSTSCVNKSEYHKNNIKQTCIKKYGVEYITQTDIMKNKSQEVFLQTYGNKCMFKTNYFKEKSKQKCLELYGKEHYVQTDEYILKSRNTCNKKYGTSHQLKNDDIKNQVFLSKKRNKTVNTSKIEQQFKKYLEDNNFNFIYQYTDKSRYPFACDFYLCDFDLFIEIQGFWTHGFKPYNKLDIECINLLNKWILLSKEHKMYNCAIKNWTVNDVNKRNVAAQNKLNYLEIFSIDINVCISKLLEKIKGLSY